MFNLCISKIEMYMYHYS